MDKFKLYSEQLAKELKKAIAKVEIKASEEDKDFLFDVVASTEDVDRDWEVIKMEGWDTKNWEKNPVILMNHSYKVEDIIWKGFKFYTSNWVKRLKGVFSKTNPKAVIARDLYNEGMLKTVSVWFIPWKRNANDPSIIEKAELLEVSFVAVPANPEAVSLDWKAAELHKKGLEAWIIQEAKEFNTEAVSAADLKVWDVVAFRHVERYTRNWVEETELYPNEKRLPRMGKLIQKIEDWSEVLTWSDEAIIWTTENPILTIQIHVASEDWPKSKVSNFVMRKFSDLQVEKIVEVKEVEKELEKLEEEKEEIKSNPNAEMQKDIAEIKSVLKTLADKNAEEDWQEDLDKKEAELLEKKETLQSIDKAIWDVLKNFKSLK